MTFPAKCVVAGLTAALVANEDLRALGVNLIGHALTIGRSDEVNKWLGRPHPYGSARENSSVS